MEALTGRAALITGGGTGIGQGIALALAVEGVRVVVCGRRKDPLDRTVDAIEQQGGKALAIQADVAEEREVEKAVRAALEAYGRIDVLINNAGIGGGDDIHQHSVEDWDRVLEINLRGPFLMARTVLPHMRAQKSGHIINISSESGLNHYEGDGAYGVSKHALNALGEYIQRENQELNIRVDTICPGMVVTEMTENSSGLNRDKCLYPEDIAELVIWLVSRRPNVKIGTPILIQTMENPWE